MAAISFSQLSVEPCRHGVLVWPARDEAIGRALGLYGEFADAENQIMLQYVKTGDVVVDVGANLGTTVLPLAKAVGNSGQVIAFEPQPLMAQCLQTSLTLNELFNVRVLTAALADTPGWARIPVPGVAQGGNYGSMSLGTEGLQVPVMRLDDFELPACALLKVDVEGYEWPVIKGAKKLLLGQRPVVYAEAKKTPGTVAYIEWLLMRGWRCYWHFAFFYQENNFRRNRENIFGGTGDMNVLAVPVEGVQPLNLPEIRSAGENWEDVYVPYFLERRIPMP